MLHSRFTATSEDDVPLMFLKFMSLNFTLDGACTLLSKAEFYHLRRFSIHSMKIIIKKKESENQQMVMRMNYRYITLEEQDEEGQYD